MLRFPALARAGRQLRHSSGSTKRDILHHTHPETQEVVRLVKRVNTTEPFTCRLYLLFAVTGFCGCWNIMYDLSAGVLFVSCA